MQSSFFPRLGILVIACLLLACQQTSLSSSPATPASVVNHYADIALAAYEDALVEARNLEKAVTRFLEQADAAGLELARTAWLQARVPYQQTEVFRFGNAIVDDWEGRVNAWPLDEGLIDYTATTYGTESDNNLFYTANVIANEHLNIGGIQVDASRITPALLSQSLHEIDGVEANVATGYHAIEFLLWGQDLNGTGPGAGMRPYTDYSLSACSHGNCQRRRDYLQAAVQLLVRDLEEMTDNWKADGAARQDLLGKGESGGLATMLTGMGSLAFGELAGERIRLGLLLHDPEEEHDCFSDNTHHSHYYDAKGIANIYLGRYRRIDGSLESGPSLSALVARAEPALNDEMLARIAETEAAMTALVEAAEQGRPFDVLIASGNREGEAIISRVLDALVAETRSIEKVIVALDLTDVSIESSDSLSGM